MEQIADALWSDVVIARCGGICEACKLLHGISHPATEAAHIISRRYEMTRHIPINGVGLCHEKHEWLRDHPPGKQSRMGAFVVELRGQKVLTMLERLARKVWKFDPLVVVMLRAQLAYLRRTR